VSKNPIIISILLLPIIASGGQAAVTHLQTDTVQMPEETAAKTDTSRNINYWNITPLTGIIIPINPDTTLTDYSAKTNPDGANTAVAHLGNLGLPMESRLFFLRPDRSEFMFFDNFRTYTKRPGNFPFTNTKSPLTNVKYHSAGSRDTKEERLQILLTTNFGKHLNIGFDLDYLYARGYYISQSAKHTEWTFFGNYISDRHQLHILANPASYTNAENGGIQDVRWISNPDEVNNRNQSTQNIPTSFTNTWNYLKGGQYYLNYRYNIGFTRETDSIFVPVSSIIYTLDAENRKHRFYSRDKDALDNFYNNVNHLNPANENDLPNDSTQWQSIKNVIGIALREGFNSLAKFDLTAYIRHDLRKFRLMDNDPNIVYSEKTLSSQYVGGEITKQKGKHLRYNAEASLGLPGYNSGDVLMSGAIETRIPLFNDTASIIAKSSLKNLSPTYYENHYHSRYLSWNENFDNTTKISAGGKIISPKTNTKIEVDVENITGYIYFSYDGKPQQYKKNIQITALSAEQKIKLGAFNWNTQATLQTSSNNEILPLPLWCARSNLFAEFKIARVLTVQPGVNVHLWSRYYAPTYEPATQQFKLQNTTKIGEYPIICAYLNCHLKETIFFIEYYNLSPTLLEMSPNYFSIPMYPLNPPGIRMGLSVNFHN
jgi:hypothetical protein